MLFTIDQKYYNQKQDLLIGAPTSPWFAKIYIKRVGKKSYLYNVKRLSSIVQKSWRYICNDITWSWRDIAIVKSYWWEHRIYYGKDIWEIFTISGLHHKFKWKERNNNKSVWKSSSHRSVYSFLIKSTTACKVSTIKTLVRRARFVCTDQRSLNKEMSYIRKTMQLNGIH